MTTMSPVPTARAKGIFVALCAAIVLVGAVALARVPRTDRYCTSHCVIGWCEAEGLSVAGGWDCAETRAYVEWFESRRSPDEVSRVLTSRCGFHFF